MDILQYNKVLATGAYRSSGSAVRKGFLVKMDENGQNNEGALPMIPFSAFHVINTTQYLSLSPFSPIV